MSLSKIIGAVVALLERTKFNFPVVRDYLTWTARNGEPKQEFSVNYLV